MRRFLPILAAIIWYLVFSLVFSLVQPVWAQTQTETGEPTVTATVPILGAPDTPTLISPANNSVIATRAPTFIFDPSLGAIVVTHYQLWIDGNKNTDHIPAYNLTITTNALTSLNEGSHAWFIKAIGSNGQTTNSATWTFTIDTTSPSLVLDSVAGQTYTGQPTLTTNQRKPEFIGRSDTGAAITLSLSGSSVSLNLSAIADSNGKFALKPQFALPPGSYTISVSSSDEPGNTTSLPSFTLVISQFVSGFTIPLPSPLPDLSFNLPFLTGTLIPEGLTAFPIAVVGPILPILLWLVLILLLIHLYQLRKHSKQDKRAGMDQSVSLYVFLIAAIILLSLWIIAT